MNWLLPHLILRFRVKVHELSINVKENIFNIIGVRFKLHRAVESIFYYVVGFLLIVLVIASRSFCFGPHGNTLVHEFHR